nr:hypothetical protein [Anaerolineae bacterium]
PYGSGNDYLVCIVSTQVAPDPHLLELDNRDITGGALSQRCYLRPCYVYSVGESLIKRRLGALKAVKLDQVIQILVTLLKE